MSALQEALSKIVAELAKATLVRVESLDELKKISAAAHQTATAAAQTKVAIDALSKANATNTTDVGLHERIDMTHRSPTPNYDNDF